MRERQLEEEEEGKIKFNFQNLIFFYFKIHNGVVFCIFKPSTNVRLTTVMEDQTEGLN